MNEKSTLYLASYFNIIIMPFFFIYLFIFNAYMQPYGYDRAIIMPLDGLKPPPIGDLQVYIYWQIKYAI